MRKGDRLRVPAPRGSRPSVHWSRAIRTDTNHGRPPRASAYRELPRRVNAHSVLKCLARRVKHHYHPDYSAGNRRRPDDGKP